MKAMLRKLFVVFVIAGSVLLLATCEEAGALPSGDTDPDTTDPTTQPPPDAVAVLEISGTIEKIFTETGADDLPTDFMAGKRIDAVSPAGTGTYETGDGDSPTFSFSIPSPDEESLFTAEDLLQELGIQQSASNTVTPADTRFQAVEIQVMDLGGANPVQVSTAYLTQLLAESSYLVYFFYADQEVTINTPDFGDDVEFWFDNVTLGAGWNTVRGEYSYADDRVRVTSDPPSLDQMQWHVDPVDEDGDDGDGALPGEALTVMLSENPGVVDLESEFSLAGKTVIALSWEEGEPGNPPLVTYFNQAFDSPPDDPVSITFPVPEDSPSLVSALEFFDPPGDDVTFGAGQITITDAGARFQIATIYAEDTSGDTWLLVNGDVYDDNEYQFYYLSYYYADRPVTVHGKWSDDGDSEFDNLSLEPGWNLVFTEAKEAEGEGGGFEFRLSNVTEETAPISETEWRAFLLSSEPEPQ